jgi:uncharacterized glyoxalase superfamily protein PhnB
MTSAHSNLQLSVMLAVENVPKAKAWYTQALGATMLWDLGSVAGLELAGAPFFLGEPANNGWEHPIASGTRSVRVEVFSDDPGELIRRALAAGAIGSLDDLRDHEMPWGLHRQGGFVDPFGHLWLVGDKSPLRRFPS